MLSVIRQRRSIRKYLQKDIEKEKLNDKIKEGLKELNAIDRVDWNKIKEAIEKKDGLVWDVSL